MTLNELVSDICGQICIWLPDLKTCAPHGGRFDKEEIRRVAGRSPAVYVAVLGLGNGRETGTGELDVPVAFAAYAAAVDKGRLSRDAAALNIVECLVTNIPGQNWGHPEQVMGADPASAKNLYAGVIAQKGVALWAVAWHQNVRVGDDVFTTDLPMPQRLYLGQSPDIGQDHEADYEIIAEKEAP